ncbi:MAG: hypothetical protein K2N20_00300, partial [Helicobacter sp.]|nr:hypothetical protein [Helicobacter sp.]
IERRLAETRQTIYELADLFMHESLRNLTLKRLRDAGDNLEELCAIYKEESFAHDIELDVYVLFNSHYHETIMQRLLNAYSARDFEELQTIADDAKRLRTADSLSQHIKSFSLGATLQRFTEQRIANAGSDIDELRRIKKEVVYADKIEQYAKDLDEQSYQEIYKSLEDAFRNRDFDAFEAICQESENCKKPQAESQPITINDNGDSYEFLADTLNVRY